MNISAALSIIENREADVDDGLDIPEHLRVENRRPLSPEAKAKLEANLTASKQKETDPGSTAVAAELAERKRTKREVKKERKAAEKTGKTTTMPLSGAEAVAAITGKVKRSGASKPKPPGKAKGKSAPKGGGGSKPKKASAAKGAKPKKPAKAKSIGDGSKVAAIGKLLLRPGGCTTADVLAATGWPSVSMPQQAKAAGLRLRKEKDGKVSRYFGTAS